MTNADVISWTCPRSHRTICERRLVWRGQVVARLFAARHAGFLTDLDVLTLEELDQEPIYRDMWRPRGTGWAVGTAIPIPTGEKLTLVLTRLTERGPVEHAIVQKLEGGLLEIYRKAPRYITVTGVQFNPKFDKLINIDAVMDEMVSRLLGPRQTGSPHKPRKGDGNEAAPDGRCPSILVN